MQVVIVLILMIVAFALGVVMGPAVESGTNMAEQFGKARDAMGMCGGSNPCAAADMAPAEEMPAEPAMEEAPSGEAPPAEEAPAEGAPPQ